MMTRQIDDRHEYGNLRGWNRSNKALALFFYPVRHTGYRDPGGDRFSRFLATPCGSEDESLP